jgi:hypothetical protein
MVMTTSPREASFTDPAPVPPAATSSSMAAVLTSKPSTW